MQITLTFKTPDAVQDCIDGAEQELINQCLRDHEVDSEEELEDLVQEELMVQIHQQREDLTRFLSRWVRYSEVLTVEFDTEDETCRVVPVTR